RSLRHWPLKGRAGSQRNDEEARAMLGDAVLVSVEDGGLRAISQLTQGLAEPDEDRALVPGREIRDVLEEHRARLYLRDDVDEAAPHPGAGIVNRALAGVDQSPQLRVAGPRERLAGHTACDQIDLADTPRAQMVDEVLRIKEVAVIAQAA